MLKTAVANWGNMFILVNLNNVETTIYEFKEKQLLGCFRPPTHAQKGTICCYVDLQIQFGVPHRVWRGTSCRISPIYWQ